MPGRRPGLHLSEEGQAQAERIADRFGLLPIKAIYSSPIERATETAEPLARRVGVPVQTDRALIEVETGDWTGRPFSELDAESGWSRFNTFRSSTRIPNGELMLEVQVRVVDFLEKARKEHPDELVALFSHGDVVKSAVMLYAGIPLDFCNRIEISPGSATIIGLDDSHARVLRVNDTGLPFDF